MGAGGVGAGGSWADLGMEAGGLPFSRAPAGRAASSGGPLPADSLPGSNIVHSGGSRSGPLGQLPHIHGGFLVKCD